jgi:hydrogenase maturation protease
MERSREPVISVTDHDATGPVDSTGPARTPEHTTTQTLIIGCGNLLRGDDAVGPILIRHLWERGLPPGVRCADGGTGGGRRLQMRDVAHVISSTLHQWLRTGRALRCKGAMWSTFPACGRQLARLPVGPCLAFARWALKDDYPSRIDVYLIEAQSLTVGDPLSPPVERTMHALADLLLRQLHEPADAVT